MKRTKFPYRLWRWTGGNENLFKLNRESLALFAAFVGEAA